MRRRVKKKLPLFSPSRWSWWRENIKRDSKESRFVSGAFYNSNPITESMRSFYYKKQASQVTGKKFRSKKRAVSYIVSIGPRYYELLKNWRKTWEEEAKEDTYFKHRFR